MWNRLTHHIYLLPSFTYYILIRITYYVNILLFTYLYISIYQYIFFPCLDFISANLFCLHANKYIYFFVQLLLFIGPDFSFALFTAFARIYGLRVFVSLFLDEQKRECRAPSVRAV